MSRQLPLDAEELPDSEQRLYDARAASLQRRRVAASRVRRRRLLAADLAVGAALALFGLIVAPGLAILALAGLAVLALCGIWMAGERLLRRRARRARLARRPGRAVIWRPPPTVPGRRDGR
jgi:hypothetical protein